MGSNKRKHSRERRRRVQVSPHSSEDGPTSDAAGPDADGDVPVNEGSEECDPSQRSTDWEREAEEAAAPRLPTAKKKPRHHGPILAAHRSRGNRRQCTTPTRQRRRSAGAAASAGPVTERGSAPPLIPKPPAAPPPPGLRHHNVTLRAPDARRSRATAADPALPLPPPGLPGPPRGRTPEEHYRLAVEFAESLDELEASCYSLRGRLQDVRYYVSVHCLMLSRHFEINR